MKFKLYTIVLFTTLQIQYGNTLIKSKQKDVFFPVKNTWHIYIYNLKQE